MAGLTSLLNTAKSGLTASSYALGVTGNNITNASTVGYTRQEALLAPHSPGPVVGGGVDATGIRRITDAFTERKNLEAHSDASFANSYDTQLAGIEALFNDMSGMGLGTALNELFDSFATLSSNPSDTTVRSTVLSRADAFAERVRDTGNALASARTEMVQQAKDLSSEITEKASSIADLNRRIRLAENLGEEPGDLKDKRNQLLLSLSEMIDTTTFQDGSGNLVVRAAGMSLVEGDGYRKVSVGLHDDGSLAVLMSRDGEPPADVTVNVVGGKLAALREVRDTDIAEVSQRLDSFVFDVATAINTQHQMGFGLDGSTGLSIFDLTATADGAARAIQLSVALRDNPRGVAASGSALTLPGGSDNAASLADLSTQFIVAGRTASDSYSSLVGDLALRKERAANQVDVRTQIAEQASAMRESLSGVSLDEEFVALTKFQRSYEASARVLTTADQLLQELLAVKR